MSQHTPWPTLDRYAHDLLDSAERHAVDAHAHECAECTASLRRLRGEEESLRQALAPEDADEETVEQVIAALPDAAARSASTPSPRRLGALVPLLAAAALITVVIIATVRAPRPVEDDPVASALAAYAAGRAGAEATLVRLGRKCLPDVRKAEAAATGAARERLASLRAKIENALPRVLWVEGHPRNDYSMFAAKLRADGRFQTQTLVLENKVCDTSAGIEFPFRTPISSFPTKELLDYDVVMLGSFVITDPAAPGSIESFVTSYGGGALMIAGRQAGDVHSACASIAPVEMLAGEWQPATIALAEAGQTHCATDVDWKDGPRVEFFASLAEPVWCRPARAKPEATVLVATKEGAPVLAVWERGRGRVAHMATEDHWIWKADRQSVYYRAVLNYLAKRD
jgi:anti-sigma factor ChrR (cupin superfamily)